MKRLAVGACALALCAPLLAKQPDCTAPDQGPAAMARAWLTESGEMAPGEWDTAKTVVTLLSSQKIGKDLFRQVHLILFAKKAMRPSVSSP